MKIENENSFRSHLQKGINLFVGAGFSVNSRGMLDGIPKSMPVGDMLRKEILKAFGRNENTKMPLSQLC